MFITIQTHHWKEQTKITILRVIDQSMRCHHFENLNCYKVLYGNLAHPIYIVSAIQDVIKIDIFKMMVLRDTLVYMYDSENRYTLISFFQWCVFTLCLARFYRYMYL